MVIDVRHEKSIAQSHTCRVVFGEYHMMHNTCGVCGTYMIFLCSGVPKKRTSHVCGACGRAFFWCSVCLKRCMSHAVRVWCARDWLLLVLSAVCPKSTRHMQYARRVSGVVRVVQCAPKSTHHMRCVWCVRCSERLKSERSRLRRIF